MVLLRLEIVNDYWVVEKNSTYDANTNNEYLYKRKGYWDSYNLLRASPVIYWEQPLSFEQFANNIWANGFVALLDARKISKLKKKKGIFKIKKNLCYIDYIMKYHN